MTYTEKRDQFESNLCWLEELAGTIKAKIKLLESELGECISREFIEANQIFADMVETVEMEGKTWSMSFAEYGECLAKNSSRPWAGFHGQIYRRDDVIANRMKKTWAYIEHVPSREPLANKSLANEKTNLD